MDRLTKKISGGVDMFGQPIVGTYECDMTPGMAAIKVRCTLGRYEDTGLTPEQIMEMKRGQEELDLIGATPGRYEDLQRECDRLQADRDAWKRRAEAAEKVCSAAHMYIKHINSPLCVGWDLLLDALRKWTDERRPRDEGKEVSE